MNILKVMEDQRTVCKVSNRQFALSIDMDPSNLTKIKKSNEKTRNYGFTLEQVQKIGDTYNVDMNYIFGFTDKMYRKTP